MFLFNILHPNGKPWTNEEMEDYLIENDSFLLNFWTFLVSEEGRVFALDKCGQAQDLNPDDFKIIWNRI